MAARGLIMAREMRVPSSGYSLGKVATSGYYGDWWGHILTDDERAIEAPLTKAHLAQLIYRAMLAASPQAEGSSAEAPVEAVAWRYRQTSQPEAWAVSLEDMSDWTNLTVQPLYTHPTPIKPSADTGELRERVARIVDPSAFLFSRDELDAKVRHHPHDAAYAIADAILSLIQSERAG